MSSFTNYQFVATLHLFVPSHWYHNTSDIKCHQQISHQAILQLSRHYLCVLQSNSILTISTWNSCRPHRSRSHLIELPLFQMTVASLRLPPIFWPNDYKLGIPDTLSVSIIRWHDSQNSVKHFTCTYQFIIKDTTQEWPNGRDHRARYLQGLVVGVVQGWCGKLPCFPRAH